MTDSSVSEPDLLEEQLTLARREEKSGQVQRAYVIYQKLLKTYPNHPQILDALGLWYAHQGLWKPAKIHVEQALFHDPSQAHYHYHFAMILNHGGNREEAIQYYLSALALQPKFPQAHNNLGNIYYQADQLSQAKRYYQQALDSDPHYTDAWVNLAMVYRHEALDDQAQEALQTALETAHEPFVKVKIYYLLGTLDYEKAAFQAAIEHLTTAIHLAPTHCEARRYLALAHLQIGERENALFHYTMLIKYAPDDSDAHFDLGAIQLAKRELAHARYHFNRVIALDPQYAIAHNNLGYIALLQGRREEAIVHYERVLYLQPDNEAVRHTLVVLSGKETPPSPPDSYIQGIFDCYAEHYDEHLQSALEYQVPQQIRQALVKHTGARLASQRIMDLGCGTGLCGEQVLPYASELRGIDLSEHMLAKAREKSIYHALIHGEICQQLSREPEPFDVIIAADTVPYFGDLTALFRVGSDCLVPGGYFIFTAESSASDTYELFNSGRYGHGEAYLRSCATGQGFTITALDSIRLRNQDGTPVQGYCLVLQYHGVSA